MQQPRSWRSLRELEPASFGNKCSELGRTIWEPDAPMPQDVTAPVFEQLHSEIILLGAELKTTKDKVRFAVPFARYPQQLQIQKKLTDKEAYEKINARDLQLRTLRKQLETAKSAPRPHSVQPQMIRHIAVLGIVWSPWRWRRWRWRWWWRSSHQSTANLHTPRKVTHQDSPALRSAVPDSLNNTVGLPKMPPQQVTPPSPIIQPKTYDISTLQQRGRWSGRP